MKLKRLMRIYLTLINNNQLILRRLSKCIKYDDKQNIKITVTDSFVSKILAAPNILIKNRIYISTIYVAPKIKYYKELVLYPVAP